MNESWKQNRESLLFKLGVDVLILMTSFASICGQLWKRYAAISLIWKIFEWRGGLQEKARRWKQQIWFQWWRNISYFYRRVAIRNVRHLSHYFIPFRYFTTTSNTFEIRLTREGYQEPDSSTSYRPVTVKGTAEPPVPVFMNVPERSRLTVGSD